jgi:hypothetical protein
MVKLCLILGKDVLAHNTLLAYSGYRADLVKQGIRKGLSEHPRPTPFGSLVPMRDRISAPRLRFTQNANRRCAAPKNALRAKPETL